MRAKRTDGNQSSIVESLRKYPGISVAITSALGNGFVDTVVGYNGMNFMIEIKDPNQPFCKRKLTPAEDKFHKNWKGQISVCETIEEVLKIIKYNQCQYKLTSH